MKTVSAVIGLASLLVLSSAVGQDVQVKQRAKEVRDQNNVRQGVTPATQPSPGAGTTTPSLSPSLVQFQTGLASINAGTQVDAGQTKQLSQQVLAAAQGGKPSAASVNKLVAKLTAAFAEKPLPASSRSRLVVELDAVLNPAKYPQAKLDGIFPDIQAIFQENGLSRTKAAAIVEDVKAVAAEVRAK
jgi:hypothetical protein